MAILSPPRTFCPLRRDIIPKQTGILAWVSIAFAVVQACLYPFIRKVDDLFSISTELAIVTAAVGLLAREKSHENIRTKLSDSAPDFTGSPPQKMSSVLNTETAENLSARYDVVLSLVFFHFQESCVRRHGAVFSRAVNHTRYRFKTGEHLRGPNALSPRTRSLALFARREAPFLFCVSCFDQRVYIPSSTPSTVQLTPKNAG